MTTRDVGDRVNLQHLVYDADGALTNATVVLTVTDPTGDATTPSVTNSSTGTYDAGFTLTEAGTWSWKWTVSGAVVDVDYGSVLAADPAPPSYAQLAVLKETLGILPSDTTRDAILLAKLDAASRSVEKYCDGRRFYLATVASARTFATRRVVCLRDGTQRLPIDDVGFATMTVEIGDGSTYTTITDYETHPDNALAKGEPIEALVSTGTQWSSNRRIRVTARWGWPAYPTAVVESTLLQASRLYRRKDSPEGVAGSAEWGLVRVPNLDPDVKALLMNAGLATPFRAA